jgi:hypothetical protein
MHSHRGGSLGHRRWSEGRRGMCHPACAHKIHMIQLVEGVLTPPHSHQRASTTWMRTSASIANVRQGSSLLPGPSNSSGTWAPSRPSSSASLPANRSAPKSSHHSDSWSVQEPVLLELSERLLTLSLVLLSCLKRLTVYLRG